MAANGSFAQVLTPAGGGALGGGVPGQSQTFAADTGHDHEHNTKPRVLPKYYPRDFFLYNIDTLKTWDTSFNMVQRYNPLFKQGTPFIDLGPVGSPTKNLTLNPFYSPGLISGFNVHQNYNLNTQTLPVYRCATPFSNFSYVQGGGAIILKALHTQNFSPTWNVSAAVNSYQVTRQFLSYSEEKYGSLHRSVSLGSHYKNKKGNYYQSVVVTWNRARRNEPGGTDTGYFDKSTKFTLFNKAMPFELRNLETIYSPLLGSASSVYRNHSHSIIQALTVKKGLRVFHEFRHDKDGYVYTDNSVNEASRIQMYDTFNRNLYLFKTSFRDSNAYVSYLNNLGFFTELKPDAKIPFMLKAYASYSKLRSGNLWGSRYSTSSFGVHGDLKMDPYENRKWQGSAHADFYFGGDNSGDYYIEGNLSSIIMNKLRLNAGIKSQLSAVPIYYRKFFSNYFYWWNSNYSKILNNEINGSIRFNNYSDKVYAEASLQTGTSNNMIYINENRRPAQLNAVMAYYIFKLTYKQSFKKFGIEERLMFQSNNQMNYMPVPEFTSVTGLYYQSRWFKKVLKVKIGLDISWYSAIKAYVYNPETALFSISNSTQKLGNYPQADVYFSGEVKTVQLFFKLEHWNNNFYNYGFNNYNGSTLNYPRESMLFRLGLVWRFFN